MYKSQIISVKVLIHSLQIKIYIHVFCTFYEKNAACHDLIDRHGIPGYSKSLICRWFYPQFQIFMVSCREMCLWKYFLNFLQPNYDQSNIALRSKVCKEDTQHVINTANDAGLLKFLNCGLGYRKVTCLITFYDDLTLNLSSLPTTSITQCNNQDPIFH